MIYEEITTELGNKMVKRTHLDGAIWWIPIDETNSDYQAYLKRDEPQVEHLTEIPTV